MKIILEEDREIINEGIKFFKVSNRLFKLNEKIIKSVDKTNSVTKKEILVSTANKVQRLGNKFKQLEDEYSDEELRTCSKPEIKKKYHALIKDYKDILTIMKKEETKTTLKTVSMFGAMVLSMVIPLKFMAPVATSVGVNLNSNTWIDLLKRSGIFLALSMPIKGITSLFNKLIGKRIDKNAAEEKFNDRAAEVLKDVNLE